MKHNQGRQLVQNALRVGHDRAVKEAQRALWVAVSTRVINALDGSEDEFRATLDDFFSTAAR